MPKRTTKAPKSVSEALREAILESGHSAYALEKATGVLKPSIRRFILGESRLRVDNVDKLADFLGYELRKKDE